VLQGLSLITVLAGGEVVASLSYDMNMINENRINQTLFTLNGEIEKEGINDFSELCILHIGIFEAIDILNEVEDFNMLSNLTWFGSDAITSKLVSPYFIENAPDIVNEVNYFCLSMGPSYNKKYLEIKQRFEMNSNQSLDFVQAARYDACWLFAIACLKFTNHKISNIGSHILQESREYTGAVGKCTFNQNLDRINGYYDIIGFEKNANTTVMRSFGYYNGTSNIIFWRTHPYSEH